MPSTRRRWPPSKPSVRVTESKPRGHLLDTSALVGLKTRAEVSRIVATAPHFHVALYAPVACVDAADRIEPGIARHVGRLPAIETIDLTYDAVLQGREMTPDLPLPVAQVLYLARMDWSRPVVTTAEPDLYRRFGIDVYPIGN
jgi:hypothetical protein